MAQSDRPIVIAATFTAEPLEMPLRFWLQELGMNSRITFAPYNQVFQQLLDPTSAMSSNAGGINILLLRFEDWGRYGVGDLRENDIVSRVDELIASLRCYREQTDTPTLVWVGPASAKLAQDAEFAALLAASESKLRSALANDGAFHWVDAAALDRYPVQVIEDPHRDRIGHIPFTPPYFTALATAMARCIHMMQIAPYKVLVMDCDNTLWNGIVGEDGPRGVTFPHGKIALQQFGVRQQQQGMVLCLVSKNAESDVAAVFADRAEMPLKREHLVAWRINWRPKWENVVELAKELNLGLDSFIFIDDNPVECAEMRARLPEVLTLELPAADAEIPAFLDHVWAFDRSGFTTEDRERTRMYRQNLERERFAREVIGIDDFLSGLKLKIDIDTPSDEEWSRVSQLTLRTNQFNFSTVRRSEAEVRRLTEERLECLRVKVSDRFGDYGLVGVVIFGQLGNALRVDTMLLSCRVLGRGIEHAMIARLGRIAIDRRLSVLEIPFVPSARNQPVADFLQSMRIADRQQFDSATVFHMAAEEAAQLKYVPAATGNILPPSATTDSVERPAQRASAKKSQGCKSARYMRIATELRSVDAIQQAVDAGVQAARPETGKQFVAPRTEPQARLAKLLARLLHVDRVGIYDEFTALGGTSLIAAQLFAEIESQFGVRLPMTTILEAPTVEQLTLRLTNESRQTLKLLKPGSAELPPIFFIHDGDGETLLYAELAHELPAGLSVYGVEPFGDARCPIRHTRVTDMAAYYADQMQQVFSQGPYYVAGMCAGGVIAFEIAAQLRAKGLKVGLVAMLDSAYPHAQRKAGLVAKRRGARFLSSLRGGETHQPNRLQHLARATLSAVKKVRNLIIYEVRSRAVRLTNDIRLRLLRKATDRGRKIPWYLQGMTTRTVYELAEKDYQPAGSLDVPVILFRATSGEGDDEPFINLFSDALLGWTPDIVSELKVIDVPGGHSSMLQQPNVATLAACLCAYLPVESHTASGQCDPAQQLQPTY